MQMTGGQALARQLVAEGVTDLFGIPGVQMDWATDALNDVAGQIRFIVPRHEQAASYMADGYARTTGRPGVCMVVPGPGLLNAMSGLATAYACSSPVLCIAGQIPSTAIGKGWGLLHEVNNQSGILASVTKWSRLARTPTEIAPLVHQAFVQLRSGHARPVGLEIPPDVLQARGDVTLLDAAVAPAPAAPPAADTATAAQWLHEAGFPVIYAGGGVMAAGATEALQKLADALQAPVVMSDNGRGALSDRHPLALLNLAGRVVLPHADVVLVVGSRFSNGMGRPHYEAPHTRYIYLNIEAGDMADSRPEGLRLRADARAGLEDLAQALGPLRRPLRHAHVAAVRAWCDEQIACIEPQRSYLQVLRESIPDDGILVSELTQVGYAANFAYPVHQARTLITPGYQGTLGYGFPTSLGVAIGNPGRVVVSINGDGGFGWGLQELATAARYRPDLVVVVFADQAFGNVRRMHNAAFQRETGTELHNPDFVKLADAFGLPGSRVDSPAGLRLALQTAIGRGGPALIEVSVAAMPSPWHLIYQFARAPRPAPPSPLGDPTRDARDHLPPRPR